MCAQRAATHYSHHKLHYLEGRGERQTVRILTKQEVRLIPQTLCGIWVETNGTARPGPNGINGSQTIKHNAKPVCP